MRKKIMPVKQRYPEPELLFGIFFRKFLIFMISLILFVLPVSSAPYEEAEKLNLQFNLLQNKLKHKNNSVAAERTTTKGLIAEYAAFYQKVLNSFDKNSDEPDYSSESKWNLFYMQAAPNIEMHIQEKLNRLTGNN